MIALTSKNIFWHDYSIGRDDWERLGNNSGSLLWLTGLSGSGKSTIANAVTERLYARGARAYVLDGDNLRHGLNCDLGFTHWDREENIRRIGEVGKLFQDSGIVAIAASISPFRADRDRIRYMLEEGRFMEIYVKCPLPICEKRDPKGLYQKARLGLIPQFTGVSAPYEEPLNPELILETNILSVDECVEMIIERMKMNGILRVMKKSA